MLVHALDGYADAARRTRDNGGITVLVTHRFSTVSAADLVVVMADGAVAEIDRVLSEMIVTSRPGYLSLPADVAEAICVRPSGSLAVISQSIRQLGRSTSATAVTSGPNLSVQSLPLRV